MTAQPPNILFIMDDQHRFDFLGAAGADFLNTPNLDRLAERGVRFTQCATNCPVCAPARISLATGQMPFRVGSLDNSSFLPASATTYYQRLRDHGYRVGCVGKLDLAKPDSYNGRYGDRPVCYTYGFTHPEECEGKQHAGTSPTPIGPYTHMLHERGLLETFHNDYKKRGAKGGFAHNSYDSPLPADAFEDGYIGRRSAEWIDNIPDDFPWHFFASFVGPHNPYDPPTEYAERYRDAEMPPAIPICEQDKPDSLVVKRRPATPEQITHIRRQYCAAIELIDDQVGMMLDALERRGMMDNTIIVFTSDHGDMLGDHGAFTKSVPYEASIRVPLILAGPGIDGGRVSDALVELFDVNPTLCELAGLHPQEGIDAQSLVPILNGDRDEHRTETFSEIRHFRCLRTREHKLVMNVGEFTELYDLQNDPEERCNIADQNPEIVAALRSRMQERITESKWRR
jgi:arylsulfatase A-like enzyme